MKITSTVKMLIILFLLSSCKKEYLGDFDPIFIGEWHSITYSPPGEIPRLHYFIIDGDNSKYGWKCKESCLCDCEENVIGKATINRRATKFFIGNGTASSPRLIFPFDDPPYQNSNGDWEISIHDEIWTKI